MTNLKHKLPTLEDIDLSDGGFVTPKQSRWEDGVSRDFHSSVREENDVAEGVSSPSLEVMLEKSDRPTILSTFEDITEELKKTYELRHRKSQLCLKRGAKAPDCLTKLLKHIHQCRLNTVQQFHQLVRQGLSRLGEELRALKQTEDDVLEVWRKEYAPSFCDTHTLRDFSDTEAGRTGGGAEQEQAATGQEGALG
ncbi:synaptonemal complex protein 2-like [Echinops telfairi]|uniref:Synaptonemal complex protein 2-like n=1 Tax=Echinops telfairi TaxID=9371 RepID=A0AC55DR35_ECHTE|nr:synaptonemal complex protein 2-like [Echinops telfairi]